VHVGADAASAGFVPLPADLRLWIEAQAAAEDRSTAGQIRHYVAMVARAARVADRDRAAERGA
jgi:hypothetical protein